VPAVPCTADVSTLKFSTRLHGASKNSA